MLNALIVGASGYTGSEIAMYLTRHPKINLTGLIVSEHSKSAGKLISDLYPHLKNIVDILLQPMENIEELAKHADLIFLATPHKVSHIIAPQFLEAGCVVIDLSAAYRVNQVSFYKQYYGFKHKYSNWLKQAVYGLAEWQEEAIKTAQLIAVPGCYPTVSQLALKPLINGKLLNLNQLPVINAISGVSGIGRKTILSNSFCEVSLQPYGIFTHRHQPEIINHLDVPLIFIPHLGNFSRGILATITCCLRTNTTYEEIFNNFYKAYNNKPLIRLYYDDIPALKSVVNTPFCDIGFKFNNEHLIIVATEDNLLKGAAAQAVQCANIRFGYTQTLSLL